MLVSAKREYDRQRRLTALAVAETQRLANRPDRVLAEVLRTYQAAAIAASLAAMDSLLEEQAIETAAVATVAPQSLLTPAPAVVGMLEKIDTATNVSQLVQTFVSDASRTARSVDMATRPAVTGYVRSLRPPSCGRCAVLAGRVYSKSRGFERHPRCDCLMTPTDEAHGQDLVTDPKEAFDKGWIQTKDAKGNLRNDLSKADTEAVRLGADMGQVVNIRSRKAGLTVGSTVLKRKGILTPAGCLDLAGGDQAKAVELLTKYGYITAAPARTRTGLVSVSAGVEGPAQRITEVGKAATTSPVELEPTRVGNFDESLIGANPRHNKSVKVTGNFTADKATGQEIGYNYNCPNAVTAFEMRMRGQAVSAKAISNPATEGRVDKFLERWRTPDGLVPDMTQTKGLRGTQDLVRSWGEDSRGFVFIQWKGDGGHVLMARNDGGTIRFFDPQSGEMRDDSLFKRVAVRKAWATRSDDLTPAVDFADYLE